MARISVPIYENLTIVFGSERKSLYAPIRWRVLERQTSNEPETQIMKKLMTIFLLMTSLSAVANVAMASISPWPECYPCPKVK